MPHTLFEMSQDKPTSVPTPGLFTLLTIRSAPNLDY